MQSIIQLFVLSIIFIRVAFCLCFEEIQVDVVFNPFVQNSFFYRFFPILYKIFDVWISLFSKFSPNMDIFFNKIFFIKIFQLILKMSDIGLLFLDEKNEFRKMLFVSIKFILPQILTKIIQNLYFKNSIYFNSYFCKNHMENSHTYFFVEKYLATISRTKRTIAVTQNNIWISQ